MTRRFLISLLRVVLLEVFAGTRYGVAAPPVLLWHRDAMYPQGKISASGNTVVVLEGSD